MVQVGKLRQQLEDMEAAKQDLVREYEQQLKKFQEEVSFQKGRLVFSSRLIRDQVGEMLGISVVVLKLPSRLVFVLLQKRALSTK